MWPKILTKGRKRRKRPGVSAGVIRPSFGQARRYRIPADFAWSCLWMALLLGAALLISRTAGGGL